MPYKPSTSGKPRGARTGRTVFACPNCNILLVMLSSPDDPRDKKACRLADNEGRMIWNGNPYMRKGADRIHLCAKYRRDPCVETLYL